MNSSPSEVFYPHLSSSCILWKFFISKLVEKDSLFSEQNPSKAVKNYFYLLKNCHVHTKETTEV